VASAAGVQRPSEKHYRLVSRRGLDQARHGEEGGGEGEEVASADKARAGRLGTLEARRAGISH